MVFWACSCHGNASVDIHNMYVLLICTLRSLCVPSFIKIAQQFIVEEVHSTRVLYK